MTKKPGYEAAAVIAFLDECGERNEAGALVNLNDRRVIDSHRPMVERWAKLDVVPLGKVDDLLTRYGLMLWELEHFAEETLGHSGFIDPYEDPKELVA